MFASQKGSDFVAEAGVSGVDDVLTPIGGGAHAAQRLVYSLAVGVAELAVHVRHWCG